MTKSTKKKDKNMKINSHTEINKHISDWAEKNAM